MSENSKESKKSFKFYSERFTKFLMIYFLATVPYTSFVGTISFISGGGSVKVPITISLICIITIIWVLFELPCEKFLRIITLILIIAINILAYIKGIFILSFLVITTPLNSILLFFFVGILLLVHLTSLVVYFYVTITESYIILNSILESDGSNINNLYNNYLKSNIITFMILVLLIILCISAPIFIPQPFGSGSDENLKDPPDANVSFSQYSTSNGTNVIVEKFNMTGSDFIVIFEKEQESVVTENCSYGDYPAPKDSSILDLTHYNEKYSSILIPKCDYSIVKNLNINDTVEVYAYYNGESKLVDSYKVKRK